MMSRARQAQRNERQRPSGRSPSPEFMFAPRGSTNNSDFGWLQFQWRNSRQHRVSIRVDFLDETEPFKPFKARWLGMTHLTKHQIVQRHSGTQSREELLT